MARDNPVIWVKWKQKYFSQQGWTYRPAKQPVGKSDVEENDASAPHQVAPARATGAIPVLQDDLKISPLISHQRTFARALHTTMGHNPTCAISSSRGATMPDIRTSNLLISC
jgi:hypothetical protein